MEKLHGLSHLIQGLWVMAVPTLLLIVISSLRRTDRGRGHSLIGRLTWVCFALWMVGVAGTVLDAVASSIVMDRQRQCLTNLKALRLAIAVYVQDWDGVYPAAGRWDTAAFAHLPVADRTSAFQCPVARTPFGYGYNKQMDRLKEAELAAPAESVLLFEMDTPVRNAVGGVESLPHTPRHPFGWMVAFIDGHARQTGARRPEELRWKP